MGMGHSAMWADTVNECFVEETCPNEFTAFKEEWDEGDYSLPVLIDMVGEYQTEGEVAVLATLYKSLLDAFKKNTGLSLELMYHDSDNDGDRYDEVNGWFWSVEGVYTYTPAGKKYAEKIQRSTWVLFG